MFDLHSALKFKLEIKKARVRPRVRRNKSRRFAGAVRKGYKNRAFTKIYLLTCY